MIHVIMDAVSYSVEDYRSALLARKDAHWSGSPSHLPEMSLQHISGANLFPELFWKGIIMETAVKVLLHTSDRPLGFYLPIFFPCLETPYCSAFAGSSKDSFGLGHAGFQVYSFQLGSYIPQFVNDAPLHLEERIDLFSSLQEGRVAVGSDELQGSTLEAPAIEVYQEGTPAIDIFVIRQPEGESLPGAVLFHTQGAEHNLLPDYYLPYLLSDSAQKKEGVIIGRGLGLVLSEFSIKITSSPEYRGGTHLTPEELLSDAPESSGAYSLEEEPTNGGIHVKTTSLVFIEELEFHWPFHHLGNPQILRETIAGNQVPQVMAATIPLSSGTALVFPSFHFSGDLIFKKTSQQVPESLLECGGNEFPYLVLVDIYLGFLYSSIWSRCWRLHWGVPPNLCRPYKKDTSPTYFQRLILHYRWINMS
jgi:hypothetical protein